MNRGTLARLTAALSIALFCMLSQKTAAAQPPFFLYGATFFYERVPRAEWAPALARYRELGINTIDLYVMWNWHEPSDGDFDFTGRTNPRRDLVGLFKIMRADGFHVVLRPGPVIRNEWRNGGYPAWLLERPEYRMPLRDVLEGRYPATATLQNAHSDAAAAEWMSNPTHMRYATRWLDRVLSIASPWKSDIVAVALDDDQGAYLDNDTWPGPHFHRYIRYLASTVHRVLGAAMPVFINTYQMKVTASAPVWTWGNWYQSDAYSIGEHDRSQLEFSTGLLQTQSPHRPIMISEFQAGWLQDADQAWPRPADPSNTTLALNTMLQMGAHGVVNFPVQDTLNPAGWEAPWTNAFYSWDAAYSVSLAPQSRYDPTARFGELMARYGAQIAQTHPAADAAVAYLTSAYDPASIGNGDVAQIAQATVEAQQGCRIMRITCALVDLRYASARELQKYPILIVPPTGLRYRFIAAAGAKLAAYRRAGGTIVKSARFAHVASPAAGGIPNAVLLVDEHGRFGFLDVVNYARTPQRSRAARVRFGAFSAQVPALTVPARDALLLPLGAYAEDAPIAGSRGTSTGLRMTSPGLRIAKLPLRPGSAVKAMVRPVAPNRVIAYRDDVYADGYPAVVMENDLVRLIVSPCAGARAFIFEDKQTGENLFTTIGGLRDAWSDPLPPSERDYIAKYTHPIATGTFNRCYSAQPEPGVKTASAVFRYSAPDAPPSGATFFRSIRMSAFEPGFTVDSSADFPGSAVQRALQITSFAVDSHTGVLAVPNGYGFFDPARRRVTMICWSSGVRASLERHPADALAVLTLEPGSNRIAYAFASAGSAAQAQAALASFAKPRQSAGH